MKLKHYLNFDKLMRLNKILNCFYYDLSRKYENKTMVDIEKIKELIVMSNAQEIWQDKKLVHNFNKFYLLGGLRDLVWDEIYISIKSAFNKKFSSEKNAVEFQGTWTPFDVDKVLGYKKFSPENRIVKFSDTGYNSEYNRISYNDYFFKMRKAIFKEKSLEPVTNPNEDKSRQDSEEFSQIINVLVSLFIWLLD